MRAGRLLAAAIAALAALPAAAGERRGRDYGAAALIDGFVKTVFGVEEARPGTASDNEVVKKWRPGSARMTIVNVARRDRSDQVADFVGILNRTVPGLGITLVEPGAAGDKPNVVVFLVDRADYREVIRRTMPKGADTRFLEKQDCSAIAGGPEPPWLGQAMVYLVADEGDRSFRHCMVEEITQSFGPVNDDRSLKDSIYNDYNDVDRYTVFDWYILNMLYDERVRPGMTRTEARAVLPAVVADCRRRLAELRRAGLIDD